MEAQPVLESGSGPAPTLALGGITKAACPNCRREFRWSETEPAMTLCPECQQVLIVTAATDSPTGFTAEEAIARVATEMPEKVEPHQPVIPGLRPVFDHPSFSTMLFDVYDEIDRETEKLKRRKEDFGSQQKIVVALCEKRDRMVREMRDRSRDARYEGSHGNGRGEESHADDHDDVQQLHDPDEPADAVSALRDSGAVDGAALVPETGSAAGAIEAAPIDADAVIVAGESDGMPPATLQQLLAKAGADIAVADVAAWTLEQQADARTWATEQLEATDRSEPGRHISVRWPDHVSAAHHRTDGARPPIPRHPSKAARQAARQAQAATERAEKETSQASRRRRLTGRRRPR